MNWADKCIRKARNWLKLSNSGDTLKLMIPSYSRKAISGKNNNLGMVTSHKMNGNEIGNRGSKSEYNILPKKKPIQIKNKYSVKEQRADGSWFLNINKNLRCALMGFERNYPIRIPSKQLNNRFFSTLNNLPVSKLNSWFVTGFADAEACFSISITPDARLNLKWGVSPAFIIRLHIKDFEILAKIKNTLEVGKIRKNGKESVVYIVESFKELQVIIDHFDKYPLITNKISDYLLFKQCFEIIKKGEHLSEKGLLKIISLKSSLN